MKSKSEKSTTDQRVTLVTTILAAIILLALLVWGGKILWLRLRYTYTNDAQVSQYINPVIARVGGMLWMFTIKTTKR